MTVIPSPAPGDFTPTLLQTQRDCATMDARTRVLLMAVRQALIIALGALEDYLELERSIQRRVR
jgi:hypothetical protein